MAGMKKEKRGYATLESDSGGMDFRTIALNLSREGFRLGHSTVRNVLLRVLEKFAAVIMVTYDVKGDPAKVARNADFQRGLSDLLQEAVEKPKFDLEKAKVRKAERLHAYCVDRIRKLGGEESAGGEDGNQVE